MPYRVHRIHLLIDLEPEKAKKEILTMLRSTGGHRANAAKEFGCTHGTLLRWIARLGGMESELKAMDKALEDSGKHLGKSGRPPLPESERKARAKAKSARKRTPTREKKGRRSRVTPG